MFTGIVTHRGRVVEARETPGGGRRFVLAPSPDLPAAALGASIAVNGVCLTVSAKGDAGLVFDVVPETLRRTTLGSVADGDVLNLEPSLHLGDEMGGHMVQGHVEGTARVVAIERRGEDVRLAVRVGADLAGAAIAKGSVALDGVSLTVGEVWREDDEEGGECFSVYLVPHTLVVTSLGGLAAGDLVNVEPDVLGRWVEHHVRRLLAAADTQEERRV